MDLQPLCSTERHSQGVEWEVHVPGWPLLTAPFVSAEVPIFQPLLVGSQRQQRAQLLPVLEQ